jgi:hypothetical protein
VEEANSYISSFEKFSEDSKAQIRSITKKIPLYISYLQKYESLIISEEEIRRKIE